MKYENHFLFEAFELATTISQLAGEIMRSYFTSPGEVMTKADNSPVTQADIQINNLVIKRILEKYPEHAVLGEEKSHIVNKADYTWVCDPIDGTLPFSLGIPTNVFSLALVDKNGLPIIGAVYDPYLNVSYTSVHGQGSMRNERIMSVNSENEINRAVIAYSGRNSKVVKSEDYKVSVSLICKRIISLNSVLYEAMLVAAGKISATIYIGNSAHDVASAKIIVENAGGRVTDLFGNEQKYNTSINGAIISNGLIHEQLVEIAKEHVMPIVEVTSKPLP